MTWVGGSAGVAQPAADIDLATPVGVVEGDQAFVFVWSPYGFDHIQAPTGIDLIAAPGREFGAPFSSSGACWAGLWPAGGPDHLTVPAFAGDVALMALLAVYRDLRPPWIQSAVALRGYVVLDTRAAAAPLIFPETTTVAGVWAQGPLTQYVLQAGTPGELPVVAAPPEATLRVSAELVVAGSGTALDGNGFVLAWYDEDTGSTAALNPIPEREFDLNAGATGYGQEVLLGFHSLDEGWGITI